MKKNFFKSDLTFCFAVSILIWIAIFLLTSCGSAKVYKQETLHAKHIVIQPCSKCDQDGGIYVYEVMSKKPMPKPPSIQSIPGAISITRNGKYSYLLTVSPLHDQKKVLKAVNKILY